MGGASKPSAPRQQAQSYYAPPAPVYYYYDAAGRQQPSNTVAQAIFNKAENVYQPIPGYYYSPNDAMSAQNNLKKAKETADKAALDAANPVASQETISAAKQDAIKRSTTTNKRRAGAGSTGQDSLLGSDNSYSKSLVGE